MLPYCRVRSCSGVQVVRQEAFCDGQCLSGWTYTGRRESCGISGSKRHCCQTAASKAAADKRRSDAARNAPVPPRLSVTTSSAPNNFVVTCTGLLPHAPLTIRVVDATLQWVMITHIGGTRLTADAGGRCQVSLVGLCKNPGVLFFSANDGRKNLADRTGTLWSNTVQMTCR